MGLKSKTYYLNHDKYIIDGDNIIWNFHRGNHLQAGWNFRTDNYDYYEGAEFLKGTRTINGDLIHVIPDPSPNAIGDLIVSAGWGDGFCVRKMKTAGSMSVLFHDTTCPVNALCNSIGVDRVRNQAYTGGYSQAGFAKYNFADTSSISQVDTITIASNGISHQQAGYSYFNGLAVAGDWLYVGHYDIADYNYITKWNTQDSSSDDLLAWNRVTDMRYGHMRYYSKEDWIMSSWARDGDSILVVSASFPSSSVSGAQAKCLRTTDRGISNDHYTHGTILMKTGSAIGNPYHMITAGFLGRFVYLDNGFVSESVLGGSALWGQEGTVIRENSAALNRAEVRYTPHAKEVYYGTIKEHPTLKDKLIICSGDRNHLAYMGWIDQVNMVMVGDPIYYTNGFGTGKLKSGGSAQETTYASDGNEFFSGYGGQSVLVTGEDGLEYYIFSTYTNDGFRSYARSKWPDGLGLCHTASVVFGDFNLSLNREIGSIYIGNTMTDLYTASGVDLNIKVSNDGGSSWELYNYINDAYYNFTSSGNTARVRLEFSGSISQSAHYTGNSYLYVSILEKDPVPNRDNIVGYSTFNIQGV